MYKLQGYFVTLPHPPHFPSAPNRQGKQIARAGRNPSPTPPVLRPPSPLFRDCKEKSAAEESAFHSEKNYVRIFGEKGSNFVQESAQIREKLGIARKRRKHIAMRRAGRHSSPDPSCRPARIFVGVFGDFRNEGEGGTGRKNQGAVAEESDSHRLVIFHRKRKSQSSQWLEAAHFRFRVVVARPGVRPYGSRTFHRRLVATVGCSAVPVVAGRGQKSVRRSGSRPLL